MDMSIQNLGSYYSVFQETLYDNSAKQNVYTTKFQFGDSKLGNLSSKEKDNLEQQLLELVKNLNKEIETINTDLMFDYDDSISSLVVTVKQRDSGKIIRQIPTDEAMELMKKMRDIVSVILDTKG